MASATRLSLPGNVGCLCHHVFMTDVLGVDLDETTYLASFVITAPLPESVVKNAELVRQITARQEWDQRKAKGEILEDEEPPPGPTAWMLAEPSVITGVVVGLVLGLLVQLIADGLGHVFGFTPGLVGLWTGLFAAPVVFVAMDWWQGRVRDRDAKLLRSNQRVITNLTDKAQIANAHAAAMTVSQLWPQLPMQEGPVEPRLRNALWDLSADLLARRRLTETLSDLRGAAVGVPPTNPAAREVAERIERAEAWHHARDNAVQQRIERLRTLADRCQRFHDEQTAIRRAQQANLRADALLGADQVTEPPPNDEIGTFTQRLDAVLEAYRRLTRDVPGGFPAS